MVETAEELNVKIEQAKRLAAEPADPTTHERLVELIEDLERQQTANNENR